MTERIGMKNQIAVAEIEKWREFKIHGRPEKMPKIREGYELVCGIDLGAGEELHICTTVEHMQSFHKEWKHGLAAYVTWYEKPPTPQHAVA